MHIGHACQFRAVGTLAQIEADVKAAWPDSLARGILSAPDAWGDFPACLEGVDL